MNRSNISNGTKAMAFRHIPIQPWIRMFTREDLEPKGIQKFRARIEMAFQQFAVGGRQRMQLLDALNEQASPWNRDIGQLWNPDWSLSEIPSFLSKAEVLLIAEATHYRMGRFVASLSAMPHTEGMQKTYVRDITWPQPILEIRWPGTTALVINLGLVFKKMNLETLLRAKIEACSIQDGNCLVSAQVIRPDIQMTEYLEAFLPYGSTIDSCRDPEIQSALLAGLNAIHLKELSDPEQRDPDATDRDRFYGANGSRCEQWVRGHYRIRRIRSRGIPYPNGPRIIPVKPHRRLGRVRPDDAPERPV